MCFTGTESYKRKNSKCLPTPPGPSTTAEGRAQSAAPLSSPFYTLFLCSPSPSGPSIILAILPYQFAEAPPLSLRAPSPLPQQL